MIKLTINGKDYKLPEHWEDVTMEMYTKAFRNLRNTTEDMSDEEKQSITQRNEAIIISRLLGENDDFILDLPFPLFIELQSKIMFIYDIGQFMTNSTNYISIDGKKYFMPDVDKMSLRQYIDTDMILKDMSNPLQYIELLAALLVPIDGEYDGQYQDRMGKISKMNAKDVLPFVYTFFKKKELSKRISKHYSKVKEMASQQHLPIANS